jgi:hypothetical protein
MWINPKVGESANSEFEEINAAKIVHEQRVASAHMALLTPLKSSDNEAPLKRTISN